MFSTRSGRGAHQAPFSRRRGGHRPWRSLLVSSGAGLRYFADRAVERHLSPPDDHGERLCFASTIALRGFALNLSAMRGDEVQKTPFVIVGTDVGVSVPSLCHGSLHAGQHRRVFRVNGRMPRMTWTAVRVQQTVDRTSGG